jgi:NAD(P)-dependent dehydrogenase (short-subunit alcohol dehydrogenase family)
VLRVSGRCTLADAGEGDALLVGALDDPAGLPALVTDDELFDAAFVRTTLDRVAMLQREIPRLQRPSNIVVVGSDAYLGRWHGIAQAAASAAMIGIVRSLALEYAPEPLRINMLALPLGTQVDDLDLIQDAATHAFDLLTTRSITGETILLDDGNNLKLRQARPR